MHLEGLSQTASHRPPGIERGSRILVDVLDVAPHSACCRFGQATDPLALEVHLATGGLINPQNSLAQGRFATLLSPTRPKVSPGWTVTLTPSTARSTHDSLRETAECKVFGQVFDFKQCIHRLLLLARDGTAPVIRQDLDGRRALLAAHRYGQGAPGIEAAALGWIDEVRHRAGNATNVAVLPIGEAVEELLRVGMGGVLKQRRRRGDFGFLPGVHDDDAVTAWQRLRDRA